MPLDPTSRTTHTGASRPVMIAQAGEPRQGGESGTPVTGTTAETEEKPPQAGKVPDAYMLLYNALIVFAIMIAFALAARRQLKKIPKGFSNLAEFVADELNNFTVGIIGPGGEKHTPLIGTIFLYVLLMNLIGMIPGLHSPTSNVTITLTLGVVVFFYSEAVGIRNHGPIGWFTHFMGPKIGKYRVMAPLMLLVELISELFRPFTLAIRLFGNIFGEDVILFVLAGMGAAKLVTRWIPLHLPIMFLALLTDLVQAMVFATLACIYISLWSQHEEGDHHDEHHPADGGHAIAPSQAHS